MYAVTRYFKRQLYRLHGPLAARLRPPWVQSKPAHTSLTAVSKDRCQRAAVH